MQESVGTSTPLLSMAKKTMRGWPESRTAISVPSREEGERASPPGANPRARSARGPNVVQERCDQAAAARSMWSVTRLTASLRGHNTGGRNAARC